MININNAVKQSIGKNWRKPSKEEAWSVRQWLKQVWDDNEVIKVK